MKTALVASNQNVFEIKEIISEKGYRVITTSKLSDFKKIIGKNIDLAIIDIYLPISDEFDVWYPRSGWHSGIEAGITCMKNKIDFILIASGGPECVLELAKMAGWKVTTDYKKIEA